MPRYTAFLRAINIGGRRVEMAVLRSLFESQGFSSVETFIASGNVVFSTPETNQMILKPLIEKTLLQGLGYEVDTFLRTDSEMAAITTYKPFTDSEIESALAYNVAFTDQPLDAKAQAILEKFKNEIDNFHIHGRQTYWLCRKKQHESKFSSTTFEKHLGARTTIRGMNTVWRMATKYSFVSDC